jgi:hypothetical protein
MRRGNRSTSLLKQDVLKIDKDCFVDATLNRQYVETILDTCRKHRVTVLSVKSTKTRHGRHFYIKIDPPVDAHTANNLQYLLGDDANRVDFNRARIESGLVGWNKLFEAVGRRLKTLYLHRETRLRGNVLASRFFEPDPMPRDEDARQT